MIPNVLVVVAAGLLVTASDPVEDAGKKEVEKFQGTWKYVVFEVEGKQQPEEIAKFILVIKGDKWTVSAGDQIVAQTTMKLDPTKKPKRIDLTSTMDADKGRLVRGIYAWEGDKFTMCDRGADKGERPAEFGTKPNSGLVLVVLQRGKP
jgi:uncharacterized protein (TIGR03067 family)